MIDQHYETVSLFFYFLAGIVDQRREGCQDRRSLREPVRQRRLHRRQEKPGERRSRDHVSSGHHRRLLSWIIHRTSSQLGTYRSLFGSSGFLFGFLFKVKTFGLNLIQIEEKIASTCSQDQDNTNIDEEDVSKVIIFIFLIQHRISYNLKEKLLMISYNNNINFILDLHLIYQMSFTYSTFNC